MIINVIGYPSDLGGADTELWHTVQLWRSMGYRVELIPTGKPDPKWFKKLQEIGCVTKQPSSIAPEAWMAIPNLAGQIAVSFCNGHFLRVAPLLRGIGCKLVWANCMTFVFEAERAFIQAHGPFDAHVMQSVYQKTMLLNRLSEVGLKYTDCRVIRGVFNTSEWKFKPLERSREFCIGKLARGDVDKWPSDIYDRIKSVQYANKRLWLMGVNEKVYDHIGPPPHWAVSLPENAMPAQQFYGNLHALYAVNGKARENWPRVGLEAMASGVPIVAPRSWGWVEMLEHRVTGMLGDTPEEHAHNLAELAYNDKLRLEIANNARIALSTDVACYETASKDWEALFNDIGSHPELETKEKCHQDSQRVIQ